MYFITNGLFVCAVNVYVCTFLGNKIAIKISELLHLVDYVTSEDMPCHMAALTH